MAIHHYLVLVLLHIVLVIWPIKASKQFPCQHECGNTTRINFPFGIGKGCYYDEHYEVICNYSSGSPKAFLPSLNNLELLDAYSSEATIRVNIPVIPLNTSHIEGIDLSGSPFSFSQWPNKFTTMGCDSYAMNLERNDSTTSSGGCLSICTCDPTQKSGCYDFLCPILPNTSNVLNANISYLYSPTIPQKCRSVSMVEENWLYENYMSNPHVLKDRQVVPAILDWGQRVGFCIEETYSSNPTFCNSDQECLVQLDPGYVCLCDDIIDEPYIEGQYCRGTLFCNTSSSHNCSGCPDGYNGRYSGRKFSCVSNFEIQKFENKSRVKFIIIGCSGGLGLLFLLIGIWCLFKFVKRRREIKRKQKFFKRNGGLLLQQELSSNESNIEKTKLFTSNDLEKATDNYNSNRILGQGGQGTVYKGMLTDGRIVAVKKSKLVDECNVEQFINEVVILSQINHRNVVKLLGCCLETQVPLLVYEFIANGTLYQYIHDQTEEFPLTWEMRLRVAVEVSGALSYLHSAASIPIYHRDIKTANILLDDKYRSKVSDFGTSRTIAVEQTHLTTQVQGTFGYLDPEYFRSSQFTDKSDVYSFGVVLVELLTGQKPIRSVDAEEDRSLAGYFLQAMKENRLFEVLDARVHKEAEKEEIITVAMIAKRCLNLNGKKRPTMKEVAFELGGIRASIGASILQQQNCEEIGFMDGNISRDYFETASSSTGTSILNSVAFSIDEGPLISNKW